MNLHNLGNGAETPPVCISSEIDCMNPNPDYQHPLCDFFRYVEEAKQDIQAFNEAVQVYEAKMQEPLRHGETQLRYECLEATMSSISSDIRRLRNYAWRLGDKFNGHFLLRNANAVLATFQATCSLLHSIEARSRHEQERSMDASEDSYSTIVPADMEVKEPAYISRGKGCRVCTGFGARRSHLTVELDNEHPNQPAQLIYDEKMECAESAPHISLDSGGPLRNARIWRQRKLQYISVVAASIVLVMAVGFATGYTAAGIGRP